MHRRLALLILLLLVVIGLSHASPRQKLEFGNKKQYKFQIGGLSQLNEDTLFTSKANSITIRPLFHFPEDVRITVIIWANEGGNWVKYDSQEFTWTNDHQMTIKRIPLPHWSKLASLSTGEIRMEFVHSESSTSSAIGFYASNKGAKKGAEDQIMKKIRYSDNMHMASHLTHNPYSNVNPINLNNNHLLLEEDPDQILETFLLQPELLEYPVFQELLDEASPEVSTLSTPSFSFSTEPVVDLEDRKRSLEEEDAEMQPRRKKPRTRGSLARQEEEEEAEEQEEVQEERVKEEAKPNHGKEEDHSSPPSGPVEQGDEEGSSPPSFLFDEHNLDQPVLDDLQFNEVPAYQLQIPEPELDLPDLSGYFLFSGFAGGAIPLSILILLQLLLGFYPSKRFLKHKKDELSLLDSIFEEEEKKTYAGFEAEEDDEFCDDPFILDSDLQQLDYLFFGAPVASN